MILDKVQRLRILSGHYEKANRILSQQKVKVVVEAMSRFSGENNAIAWTSGEEIHFNAHKMPDLLTDKDFVEMFGVNLHELSHVMFTPSLDRIKQSAQLYNVIRDAELARLFNILEDQRIESMMVALYPSTRHYFTATVLRYVTRHINQAHVLTHGRRYLPPDLRKNLRDFYTTQGADLDRIDSVIDRYRVLDLSFLHNLTQAARLVEELHVLLNRNNLNPTDACEQNKYTSADKDRGSSPQQDEAIERVRNGDDERQEPAVTEEEDDGEEDAEGDGLQGDGADDAEDQDDGPDMDGGGDGESGAGPGKRNDGRPGSGVGGPSIDDILDAVEALHEEVERDADVAREVRQARQAVDNALDLPFDLTKRHTQTTELDPRARLLARRLTEVLRMAETDVDPGWNRQQSSGVLDVPRAMMRDPHDETIWRRWDEGNAYGTDQEIVLLLDRSGSMSGQMPELSMAAWALKRAADTLNIRLTVLAYDDSGSIVYRATDRARHDRLVYVPSGGNTYAAGAIKEAAKILGYSKRRHKLFLVMTDGAWSDGASSNMQIEKMGAAGVRTALFHLDAIGYNRGGKPHPHGCQNAWYIPTLEDMVLVIRDLMKQIIKGEQ